MLRFFAVVFFMVGLFVSMVSIHNIDISFNMRDTQIDIAPSGIQRSKPELYLHGLLGLFIGLIFLISGFTCLLWDLFLGTDKFKFK